MFPPITRIKKVFQRAVFGSAVTASEIKTKQGYVYAIASRLMARPEGHFYVAGVVNNGFKGYVTDGFLNGQKVNGRALSGSVPCYVCLQLVAPNGGKDVKILVRDTFGYSGDTYFYPLAAFDEDGKHAQLVFSGLLYRGRRKIPGFDWIHEVSAA